MTPAKIETGDGRLAPLLATARNGGITKTTLTSGTLFAGSKLPLRTWVLALHLLTSTKTNMAALELMRHLGVNHKTAWPLKHKIMQAMSEREESRKLGGFVQIDDAYLGGERNGGKPGRGSENKQPFVIAVETDQNLERPRFAVIEPVRTFDNPSLQNWVARRLAPEAEGYTDGLGCFRRIEAADYAHTVLQTGGDRGAGRTLGQHCARQRQTRHQRHLLRHSPSKVRSPLSR